MFKVGDKVKVIKVCWDYPEGKVGQIGKVIKDGDTTATLCEFQFTAPDFHSGAGKGKKNHCYWMKNECLEIARKGTKKAKAAKKTVKAGLKIGDTVRLITEYDSSGMVGELAVIKEDNGSMFGIEFINKMPGCMGHTCSGTCKNRHGWNVPKDCVELVTKSKGKGKKELTVDPRTFYKILQIDGSPANEDAKATGFKYQIPVDTPTEWTPTIKDIVACRKGYHIIDAENVKTWLGSYSGDLIVCEAKARGEIKSASDKYVAQSIQLTRVLCRWNDAKKAFEKGCSEIKAEARKLEDASYNEHVARYEAIGAETKKKESALFNELVIGGAQ